LKYIIPFIILAALYGILSCTRTIYMGSSETGFKDIHDNTITPVKALDLARAHLPKTYELRLRKRLNKYDNPLSDIIVMQGEWYFIVRDNYPYKTFDAYLEHAVKVNIHTGEIIPPE
jgi:hypothetical protein